MAEEEGLLGGEEEVGVGRFGGVAAALLDEPGGVAYGVGNPGDQVGGAAAVGLAADEDGDGDGVGGRGLLGGALQDRGPKRWAPVADQ